MANPLAKSITNLSIDLPPDSVQTESKFASRRLLPNSRNDSDIPAPPHPSTCPDMSAVKLKIQVPNAEHYESKKGIRMGLPVKRTDSEVPAPPVASQSTNIFREESRPNSADSGQQSLTRSAPSPEALHKILPGSASLSKSLNTESFKSLTIDVPTDASVTSSSKLRRDLPASRNDGDVPPPPDSSRARRDW